MLCEKEGENLKPWAEKFYKSKAWRDCREAYFIFRHGLCERCGEPGKIVHHKEYLTPENINDPNVTLSFENLELLCLPCHSNEHNRTHKEAIREGLMFDNLGNLVENKGLV